MSDLPSGDHRNQDEPNWTTGYRFSYEPNNNFQNGIFCVPKSDSSSDSSSLVSCSDEASCSTESTRNSTSTDEYSEYIFGDLDPHRWNGGLRFSNDLDGSLSSSLYSNHSSEATSYEADGVVDDRVWYLQDGGSPILFTDTTNQYTQPKRAHAGRNIPLNIHIIIMQKCTHNELHNVHPSHALGSTACGPYLREPS
ncbi:hypothetical protein BHM03_00030330 [Ensete ventricosum]|nr:hypothetical protein BHM03_00030330 [Ensete ventricosum]